MLKPYICTGYGRFKPTQPVQPVLCVEAKPISTIDRITANAGILENISDYDSVYYSSPSIKSNFGGTTILPKSTVHSSDDEDSVFSLNSATCSFVSLKRKQCEALKNEKISEDRDKSFNDGIDLNDQNSAEFFKNKLPRVVTRVKKALAERLTSEQIAQFNAGVESRNKIYDKELLIAKMRAYFHNINIVDPKFKHSNTLLKISREKKSSDPYSYKMGPGEFPCVLEGEFFNLPFGFTNICFEFCFNFFAFSIFSIIVLLIVFFCSSPRGYLFFNRFQFLILFFYRFIISIILK